MTYSKYSNAVKKFYKNKNVDMIIFSWRGINNPEDIREEIVELINQETYSEVIESIVISKENSEKAIFLEIPNNQTVFHEDNSSGKITELLRRNYSEEYNNIGDELIDLEVQLNNYESPYLEELKDYFGIEELTKTEYYFD